MTLEWKDERLAFDPQRREWTRRSTWGISVHRAGDRLVATGRSGQRSRCVRQTRSHASGAAGRNPDSGRDVERGCEDASRPAAFSSGQAAAGSRSKCSATTPVKWCCDRSRRGPSRWTTRCGCRNGASKGSGDPRTVCPYAGRRGIASAFVVSVDVQRESFFISRLVIIPLILIVLLSFSVF